MISQQTFDDAVKENVEEFSMSTDEAIQDAIQQFESQVILIILITNLKLRFTRLLIGFTGCKFAKYHHKIVTHQRSGNFNCEDRKAQEGDQGESSRPRINTHFR